MEHQIPYIPDITTPEIQQVLFNMEEFNVLKATKEAENLKGVGSYFKSQEVDYRLMEFTDRLFVIWEPGSGKTCNFIHIDEEYLKKNKKRAIYITSKSLIEATKNQIICKCNPRSLYYNEDIRHARTTTEQDKLVNRALKGRYIIITYHDFMKRCRGLTSQELQNKFSDCIFNIDEVDKIVKQKTTSDARNPSSDHSFHFDISLIDEPNTINSESEFKQLWRVLHSIKRSIAIIGTATPIINHPRDFPLLCNLLLAANKQINMEPFLSSHYLRFNLRWYAKYLNGLISYVSAPETGVIHTYKGNRLNKSYTTKIPIDEMAPEEEIRSVDKVIQSNLVLYGLEIYKQQLNTYLNQRSNRSNAIESPAIQTLLATDQYGNYGKSATYSFQDLYVDPNYLSITRYLMAKFYTILQIENEAYYSRNGEPCCAYVYSSLTNTGSAILVELLKANGYEQLTSKQLASEQTEYCGADTLLPVEIHKAKRFIYVDSEVSEKERQKLVQFFSSKKNVAGEYVQLLIGSKVFGVGINIGNVIRYYHVVPGWNEARDKQATERVFRADSHIFFKEYLKEKYGITNAQISVDIYKLVCYARKFRFSGEQNDIQEKYIAYYIGHGAAPDYCRNRYLCDVIKERDEPEYRKLGLTYNKSLSLDDTITVTVADVIQVVTVRDFIERHYIIFLPDPMVQKVYEITSSTPYTCTAAYYSRSRSRIETVPCGMWVISTDIERYLTSETKSIPAHRIMRYAKQLALDCKINRERNYHTSHEDGTPECDYDVCNYPCYVDYLDYKHEDTIVKSEYHDNYEILYADKDIEECVKSIIAILTEEGQVKIEQLYQKLSNYRRQFIDSAIYKIIVEKKGYTDRYGFNNYPTLIGNDYLVMSHDFPLRHNKVSLLPTGDYTKQIYGCTSNIGFRDIEAIDEQIIEYILSLDSYDPAALDTQLKVLLKKFNRPSLSTKKLIERVIGNIIVKEHYGLPISAIEQAVGQWFFFRIFKIDIEGNGVLTYVHNQPQGGGISDYNISTNFLKPKDGFYIPYWTTDANGNWIVQWREATKDENRKISEKVQQKINDIFNSSEFMYNGQKIPYCLTHIDGKFRILDLNDTRARGRDLESAKDMIQEAKEKFKLMGVDESEFGTDIEGFKRFFDRHDWIIPITPYTLE